MTKVLAALVLMAAAAIAAVLGVNHWRNGLLAQGEAQGRLTMGRELDELRVQQAREYARAVERVRDDEQNKAQAAERIAHEQAQRAAALQLGLDHAATAEHGLRATIDQLNARVAELSGPGTDARLADLARQASTARGLLGECSARRREVAADAAGLRDQVSGLHQFVERVCNCAAKGEK